MGPDTEVIKLFPCSTHLSRKLLLLMNVEMPTFVGILTFMSWKNRIIGLSEPLKAAFHDIFKLMSISNFILSSVAHGKKVL